MEEVTTDYEPNSDNKTDHMSCDDDDRLEKPSQLANMESMGCTGPERTNMEIDSQSNHDVTIPMSCEEINYKQITQTQDALINNDEINNLTRQEIQLESLIEGINSLELK